MKSGNSHQDPCIRTRTAATAALFFFGAAIAVAQVAADEPPQLPPTEHWPRTRSEWNARRSELEALAASTGGVTFKDMLPHNADKFDALLDWMQRMERKYLGDETRYDADLAARLIGELYVDHGHPTLNAAAQEFVYDTLLRGVGELPPARLPDEARSVLVDGLKRYVQIGGGDATPSDQTRLAAVLSDLAPTDATAQQIADSLLEDAIRWSAEIDAPGVSKTVERAAREHWGEMYALRVFDLFAGAAPVDAGPKRYRDTVAAITELLAPEAVRDPQYFARLRDVAKATAADFDKHELEDDLTTRMLVLLRLVIRRDPPPSKRIVAYVGDHLTWYATESRRLRCERHWMLWATCVRELGSARVPEKLRDYLRTLNRRRDQNQGQRLACEMLARLLADEPREASP